jgi:hypothetical protein
MRNGDYIEHPKLKVYGSISHLLFLEDGSFVCEFTYTDQSTGEVKKINMGSYDFKKETAQ